MAESRALHLRRSGPTLCPFIDLVNHEVPLEKTAPTCSFEDCPELGVVRLVADRPIQASEELSLIYDYCSSAQIFTSYGFVRRAPPGGSPHESCLFAVPDLPGDAAVRAAKIEALCTKGWLKGARRSLHLKLPDNARPGGLLLHVARLAVLTDVEEVQCLGAGILAGERSLPNPGLEAKASALAYSWLGTKIQLLEAEIERLGGNMLGQHGAQLERRNDGEEGIAFVSGASDAVPEALRHAACGLLNAEHGVLERSLEMLKSYKV